MRTCLTGKSAGLSIQSMRVRIPCLPLGSVMFRMCYPIEASDHCGGSDHGCLCSGRGTCTGRSIDSSMVKWRSFLASNEKFRVRILVGLLGW